MEIKEWNGSQNDLMRIIQESVPGKQITMAHIISSPDPVIYKKLGLDPRIDYKKAAIGVLTQTPSETPQIWPLRLQRSRSVLLTVSAER